MRRRGRGDWGEESVPVVLFGMQWTTLVYSFSLPSSSMKALSLRVMAGRGDEGDEGGSIRLHVRDGV